MACDFGVIAINSQQILRQVIATDAKEINLFAALVDDKHHRRDFQHDAKRDFLIKRNMLSAELLFRFGKFLFHPQDLFHGRDHRDHDLQAAVSRGAQDRPKLGGEKHCILFVNTYGAVTEERVIFGRDLQVLYRLIAADIHGPHDDAAPVCTFQCLTENVVELVFTGRAAAVHIKHFGAKQANALGAVLKGCLRFHRMGDVRGNLNPQAVGGSGFPVQPDALLLA